MNEIWSPDPSPNGLNNLSPSDEVLNNYQTQQLLDSPTSIIDSPELSFEQVHSELGSPNFSGDRIQQQYDEVEGDEGHGEEGGNNHNNNNMNCYYQNVPSPVYNPYSYHQRNDGGGSDYAMMMRKNEMMMNNDTSSMVIDPQNDYYSPYCMDRYAPPHLPQQQQQHQQQHHQQQHEHQPPPRYQRARGNGKYEHAQQPIQMSYDLKMSLMEELGICLDECRDQLKHLERDYRKVRHPTL